MDTKVNYAAVGLFVIVLCAALVIGFVWLSGFSNRQVFKTYLVYAAGGVTGLNTDSPVLFNGVRVGSVGKIKLDNVNPQFVKIYLKVEENIPITESTYATLVPQGITGLVYIGLQSESAVAPLLKTEPDKPYPIIPYHKPLLIQLSESLPELAHDVGQIASKVKGILNEENMANVKQTLNHLESITSMLDKQSHTIQSSLHSLDHLLKNTSNASEHFTSTIESAQRTLNQLDKTGQLLDREIDTFGQQTMPSLQELLSRANDAMANIQVFTQDLSTNPSILVRGKKSPPPGPGE